VAAWAATRHDVLLPIWVGSASCSAWATAFPSGAHNDQIDAASQYLIEAYLVGGKATLLLPTGVIPLSAARRQRQQALPVQQRLTAGGQPNHWGQALSPFQQRLTNRQRRR